MIRDCEKHSICPVLPWFCTGKDGLDRYSICPVLPDITGIAGTDPIYRICSRHRYWFCIPIFW